MAMVEVHGHWRGRDTSLTACTDSYSQRERCLLVKGFSFCCRIGALEPHVLLSVTHPLVEYLQNSVDEFIFCHLSAAALKIVIWVNDMELPRHLLSKIKGL